MNDNPIIARFAAGAEEMALHADMSISRPHIGLAPSGKWKAAALYERRGGWTRYVEPIGRTLDRLRAGEMQSPEAWRFKNGKPRYFLGDIDHGSGRVWGAGLLYIRLT